MSRTSGQLIVPNVLWAPIYEVVHDILGSTGTIIPIGDTNDENSGRTVVTTRGEVQVNFTYSEAITSFDTPPSFVGPGSIPRVEFNGTDEEADTPDIIYFTPAAAAFSLGCWVNLVDATGSVLLSKRSSSTVREWLFWSNSQDQPELILYDESTNATLARDDATTLTQNVWSFLVATHDGGTTAANINIYLTGVQVADTDNSSGAFTAVEDLAVPVRLGFTNTIPNSLFDGSMAGGPLGPFFTQIELTVDQVLRLYQLGRAALGV